MSDGARSADVRGDELRSHEDGRHGAHGATIPAATSGRERPCSGSHRPRRRAALALAACLLIAPAAALADHTHGDAPAGATHDHGAGGHGDAVTAPAEDPAGDDAGAASPGAATPGVAEGVGAWRVVHSVLVSPRCRGCHPQGDRPLVDDASLPHRMNVTRESAEVGLPCTTCHRQSNAPVSHGPPGAGIWSMPHADVPMVFEGRSAHDLCEQLKDSEATAGRDLEALALHLRYDPLVLWGWSPGPGRNPPPVPHDVLVASFERWVAAGAPCP